jgi:lysophospholipase L1-like esterase
VDLRDELRAALDAGQEPYRRGDPIHPNAVGQELLANAVARAVTAISKDVGPDDQQAPAP